MQITQFIVDGWGTYQGILVFRSLALHSFHSHLQDHLFDPFRIGPAHLLWRSRMILQALPWFIGAITIDPPLYPRTGSLHFPGNFTSLPALQIQCNGLRAQLDLSFHRYTSWF